MEAFESMASFWNSKFLFLFILSLIGSISRASSETGAEESPAKEFVVTLDQSNFTDFVSKQKFIVVEFYAPWCGACKQLAPQYEIAASFLSNDDPPVILAKVDAVDENNKLLKSEFGVRVYPTIKILRNGGSIVHEYKGSQDADGIITYLKKQSGPASAEIKSAEDVAPLLEDNKIAIIGVFPEFSGEKFENFITVAERLRTDYEFGHTSDVKLLPRGDSSSTVPIVRLFKPFDELVVDFQDFNVEVLEKLIEESSVPTVTIFDKDRNNHPYVKKFFNSPEAKAMFFVDFSSENIDTFKSKYYDIAKQFKGKGLSFLMGDAEAGKGAFEFYGLKEDQVPLIIILTDDGSKYLKTNLEPDQISAWVNAFKDGHLQPYIKSEPIPEVNNEPVKVVVADSIDDMFFKSEKNVLLEFYAPWCQFCQKLAPILDEVAVSFKKDADVVIAKFDVIANDYDSETFDVGGYPTLYFKSASGKLLKYDGEEEKTKEVLIDFIQKNRDKTAHQESIKDEL